MKDLLSGVLLLGEVFGFLLLFGIAGGLEQNTMALDDAIKNGLITLGSMGIGAFILWLLNRDERQFT